MFAKHDHFETYQTKKDKKLKPTDFKLKHYAGDVVYNVTGFLDKNKDTLFLDVYRLMNTSKGVALFPDLFPASKIAEDDKKRPVTAGTQFKTALNNLVDTLLKCRPHYIRCIKPNDEKKANNINEERTRHQIRYLGLLENVRVRRAG
jgi:myosin-1